MRSLRIFFSAQRFQYGGIAQLGERLNGIQEVSGSIPLISTKNHRFHLESMVFLYFSACFVLGVFALDNKWTTDLLNFFFLTVGRKKLWHLSKKK